MLLDVGLVEGLQKLPDGINEQALRKLVGNCFSPKALSLALPNHNTKEGSLCPSARWHPLDPTSMLAEFAALSNCVRKNLLNCPQSRMRNHLELCEMIVSSPLPAFMDSEYWLNLTAAATTSITPTNLGPHNAASLSPNPFLPLLTGLPHIPVRCSDRLFSRTLSALGPHAVNVRQYLNLPDPCEGRPAKFVTPTQFIRLVLRDSPSLRHLPASTLTPSCEGVDAALQLLRAIAIHPAPPDSEVLVLHLPQVGHINAYGYGSNILAGTLTPHTHVFLICPTIDRCLHLPPVSTPPPQIGVLPQQIQPFSIPPSPRYEGAAALLSANFRTTNALLLEQQDSTFVPSVVDMHTGSTRAVSVTTSCPLNISAQFLAFFMTGRCANEPASGLPPAFSLPAPPDLLRSFCTALRIHNQGHISFACPSLFVLQSELPTTDSMTLLQVHASETPPRVGTPALFVVVSHPTASRQIIMVFIAALPRWVFTQWSAGGIT